jgi:hypothetical protein
MDENAGPQISPEVARSQLENVAAARLGNDRDRRIHGIATIGFGLLWGGYMSYIVLNDDFGPLMFLLVVASILLAGAMYLWRERARTVPRHTGRAMDIAWGVSLAAGVIFPFLSVPVPAEQQWLDLITAGVFAAPIVLAGLWILLRR